MTSSVRPSVWIYLCLVAASAAVAVRLGWAFIDASAPTFDEPLHLASGYLGLATNLPPINYRNHPPLGELWAALPLLPLRPSTLVQSVHWGRKLYDFADAFLYLNRVPSETMLNAARRWCLVSWTLLLSMAILAWSRRSGLASMAAAALLCAFCPPLFSNAALVTTDAAPTLLYFLTFFLASIRPGRWWAWLCAGAALGLALASKFDMIALPVFLAAALLTEARVTKRSPLGARDTLLLVLAAVLALTAVYGGKGTSLYWEGLTHLLSLLGEGRSSFLAGRYSTQGSIFYFPVALAIKTPLPLLLAAALGLVLRLRRPDAEGAWLVFPAAALFVAACASKTQIGYRHILPIYPFLIVLSGQGAAWLWDRPHWGRALALALGVWLVAGVARVYPDYLAYFNELGGGPDNGYHWLADSNLDWGQGLKELGAELGRRGSPPVYLSYFGVADPSYYGIRYVPVGFVTGVQRRDGLADPRLGAPMLLAVSATNLQAVYYADKSVFSWLRDRKPIFIAGHSIFLYDLTEDDESRRRLAGLIAASEVPSGAALGPVLQ